MCARLCVRITRGVPDALVQHYKWGALREGTWLESRLLYRQSWTKIFATSLTQWKLMAGYSLHVHETATLPISAFTHHSTSAEPAVLNTEEPISNSQQLASCVPSRNITNLNNTRHTRLQRLFPTTPSRSRLSRKITQSVRIRSIKLRFLTARLHWKTSRSLCGLKCASKTETHRSYRICFHSPVHGATFCLLSAVTFNSLVTFIGNLRESASSPVLEITSL